MEEMAFSDGIRRVKGVVAYDGTDFAGWQVQPEEPSVQGALESALGRVLGHQVRVVASGRTDKGVHALGQVFHFDTANPISLHELLRGGNALLPRCVRIRRLEEAESGFHARFSASYRQYRYFVTFRDLPFFNRYALLFRGELNLDAMNRAAALLLGEHDFASFGSPMRPGGSTVRLLRRLRIRQKGRILVFTIEANAFLRLMVRNTVGALLKVGLGRWDEGRVEALLNQPSPGSLTPVPPQGLFLWRVFYRGGRFYNG